MSHKNGHLNLRSSWQRSWNDLRSYLLYGHERPTVLLYYGHFSKFFL